MNVPTQAQIEAAAKALAKIADDETISGKPFQQYMDAATAALTAAAEVGLPDWDDLRGCAPDATGSLSSEAFVRELRDNWRDHNTAAAEVGEREMYERELELTPGLRSTAEVYEPNDKFLHDKATSLMQRQVEAATNAIRIRLFEVGIDPVEGLAKAALTAAAEVGGQSPDKQLASAYYEECLKIEAATIERCAQVAETASYTPSTYINLEEVRQTIAAAIRALKDKP